MSDEAKPIRHKIGSTRSIQTAVLVCEYLKKRCAISCNIPGDSVSFYCTDPTERNGFWTCDIIVTLWKPLAMSASTDLVNTCRAFVAGRGEDHGHD